MNTIMLSDYARRLLRGLVSDHRLDLAGGAISYGLPWQNENADSLLEDCLRALAGGTVFTEEITGKLVELAIEERAQIERGHSSYGNPALDEHVDEELAEAIEALDCSPAVSA